VGKLNELECGGDVGEEKVGDWGRFKWILMMSDENQRRKPPKTRFVYILIHRFLSEFSGILNLPSDSSIPPETSSINNKQPPVINRFIYAEMPTNIKSNLQLMSYAKIVN
jgi:hypothetical protein